MRLRALIATVAACLATGAFASAAQALPVNFWGAVPQSSYLNLEEMQRLHRGGVASVRIPFVWPAVQHARNGVFDWAAVDFQIENAAKAEIEVLPFLAGAPTWAVPNVNVPGSGASVKAPTRLPVSGAARSGWAAFVAAAVARYGPNGAFWAEHPAVPVRPIRTWQIWNEPNFKYFVTHPNPAEYGKLVAASYATIKAADPGAKLILAGMFARPKGSRTSTGKHKSLNWYASDFLEQAYKTTPGFRTKFSGVALHPYTYNFQELPEEIEEIRHLMARNHDAAKGLWITEIGWSSGHPTRSNLFAKGPAGQAEQLRGAFSLFKKKAAAYRLQRIYWFSIDDQAHSCNFCDGSGLFKEGFVPKKSWYEFVKFAGGTP
ncbi:MAG TPA: glycosyl hydrolase [Solirubrobacterales bacterium]|nr:glycosyl hydrolase [Solirubrobacterales bacterium]